MSISWQIIPTDFEEATVFVVTNDEDSFLGIYDTQEEAEDAVEARKEIDRKIARPFYA